MSRWKHVSRTPFFVAWMFAAVVLALCSGTPGCAVTPVADVDRAETLYAQTLAAVNDAKEVGLIDDRTYVDVVTPARRTARVSIDRARAAVQAGDPSRAQVFLDAANAALLKIQSLRQKAGAADPISTAILLLGLITRLTPVARKLVSGAELTDEERSLVESASAVETARADRLDAEARGRLGSPGDTA